MINLKIFSLHHRMTALTKKIATQQGVQNPHFGLYIHVTKMMEQKRCLGASLWGEWGGGDLPANLCLHPQGQRLPQELAR
jgi:hypothetical protein